MSNEGRANVHPYTHAMRIETESHEGPSVTETVLGADIDVHIGTLRWRGPSPVRKSCVVRVVYILIGLSCSKYSDRSVTSGVRIPSTPTYRPKPPELALLSKR